MPRKERMLRNKYRKQAIVIGRNIDDLRIEHGLSMDRLATELGCAGNTVCCWVNGFSIPKSLFLWRLAKLMDVPMERFMKGVEDVDDKDDIG